MTSSKEKRDAADVLKAAWDIEAGIILAKAESLGLSLDLNAVKFLQQAVAKRTQPHDGLVIKEAKYMPSEEAEAFVQQLVKDGYIRLAPAFSLGGPTGERFVLMTEAGLFTWKALQ